MSSRINELDYLKGIFIILMIVFHLVYIGDKYPYVKQVVYTFHMPGFLIISGYLANIRKGYRCFFHTVLWLFIPYAIMEAGYVIMSAILPVRESVENVTMSVLFSKIFISPIGPYWYLHTLIVCITVYYFINKLCTRLDKLSFFIILGTCFWAMHYWLRIISFSNAIYFLAGVIIYQSKQSFLSVFRPSVFSAIPFAILCCYPDALNRLTLGGGVVTYMAISMQLWGANHIPGRLKNIIIAVGRNTLPILLFSPIFTILSKCFLPLFAFDNSGMCFMGVSVIFVLCGSLSIVWCMDRLSISRWFFGQEKVL